MELAPSVPGLQRQLISGPQAGGVLPARLPSPSSGLGGHSELPLMVQFPACSPSEGRASKQNPLSGLHYIPGPGTLAKLHTGSRCQQATGY